MALEKAEENYKRRELTALERKMKQLSGTVTQFGIRHGNLGRETLSVLWK